jgi:hypothetical protein
MRRALQISPLYYPASQKQPDRIRWQGTNIIKVEDAIDAVYGAHAITDLNEACQMRLSHGDLTLDSVRVCLAGGSSDVWVLPSIHMGRGCALRDLINLEADVFFRPAENEKDEDIILALRAWLSPQLPEEEIALPASLSDDLQKRLRVAQILRSFAEIYGAPDLRAYYLGMMMCAAARLVHRRGERERLPAFILSILADRIMHWENWDLGLSLPKRIKIDMIKREVILPWKDAPITLEQQPFALFALLHGKADTFLSIEECSHAWKYEVTEDMLNKAVSQLRKAIEPDPKKPQYIIRRRGSGIMFKLDS